MRGEIIEFFIIKQIKKPRLVLCSVVKHLGSGRALKKWGKTLDCVSCFPLHFFRALPLPACFTTEHSTVQASLFVNEGLIANQIVLLLPVHGRTEFGKILYYIFFLPTPSPFSLTPSLLLPNFLLTPNVLLCSPAFSLA